jgi:hypothetical protein
VTARVVHLLVFMGTLIPPAAGFLLLAAHLAGREDGTAKAVTDR